LPYAVGVGTQEMVADHVISVNLGLL
jgi:hypothetical protein